MVGGRMIIPILPLVYVTIMKLLLVTQKEPKPIILVGVTLIISLSLFFGYILDPFVTTHANGWRNSFIKRKNTGVYLRDNFPEGTLVALNPAGIIPYFSKFRTIDMLGLNDIYIAHEGKRDRNLRYGHQAGDGLYVLSRKPDVIIFGSGTRNPGKYVSDQEIWNSPLFKENYQLQEWPSVGYAYVRR